MSDGCERLSPNRPAFTPEVRLRTRAGGAFSALPESEIEPCFLENLRAALALINAAGHDSPEGNRSVGIVTNMPASKYQVVRNSWEVFRGWSP